MNYFPLDWPSEVMEIVEYHMFMETGTLDYTQHVGYICYINIESTLSCLGFTPQVTSKKADPCTDPARATPFLLNCYRCSSFTQ